MPDNRFEYIAPKRFGEQIHKDIALILIDISFETILKGIGNIKKSGDNWIYPLGDIYLANEIIIKKHMEELSQNGFEFVSGWQKNVAYKQKLSSLVFSNDCWIIDLHNNQRYKHAEKNVDYKIIKPFSLSMDLVPLS